MDEAPSQKNALKTEKSSLRKQQKAVRKAAFEKYGDAAAEAIRDFGLGFTGTAAPAVVSGFCPIGQELDPMPLMERLRADGFELCLPVMAGKDKPLVMRAWQPGDEMNEVMWGIREPLPSAPCVEPDIILAALLAFDSEGYRLGYGGGYYDRTIARAKAIKPVVVVGLAYDELRVDSVPHDDHDQPVDWILTPSGPIKCSGA